MRAVILFGWLATIFLLGWPGQGLANEVWEGPSHLVVATKQLYRLRFNGSLWQLSGALTEPIIASQTIANRLWLITGTSPSARVVWTADGLTINRPDLPMADWRLVNLGGQLLAIAPNQTWLITDPARPRALDQYLVEPTWLTSWQGRPGWLSRDGSRVWLVTLTDGQAKRQMAVDCPEPTFFAGVGILACQNNQRFYRPSLTGEDAWQPLELPALDLLTGSASMLVGLNRLDRDQLIIWQDNAQRQFRLPPLIISQITVIGRRVFLNTETGWQELNWSADLPALVNVSSDRQATIISQDDWLFFNGSKPLASNIVGDYRSLETTGNFNNVRQLADRWLIWQTDRQRQTGGLAQVSPNPPGHFQKVTGAWSQTTSPIQTFQETAKGYFVIVITNSGRGNLNLYQSLDLLSWKRLTLPTKPTLALTLDKARTQNAGALVEVAGLATVEKDQLGSNFFYLQDQTGGIQIYSSSDLSPKIRYQQLRLVGEVSSAKTKRLILSSLEELIIDGPDQPSLPIVSLSQARTRLGQAVIVSGKVNQVEKETLELESGPDQPDKILVKVHLPEAKTRTALGDKLELSVIADLNPLTELVELWWQGERLVVTKLPLAANPPPPSQPVPSVVSPSAPALQSVSPPSSSAAASLTESSPAKSSRSTSAGVVVAPTVSQPVTYQPTMVKTAASQKDQPEKIPASQSGGVDSWALPLGLSAGALAIRGRRLRRLLASPESIGSLQ